ncbi:hypothetical protein ACFL1I_05675 [Candidatus Omnitrophota bacterium]
MAKKHRQVGEALLAKGLISQAQLQKALAEQRQTGEFLGKILVKRRFISEHDLLDILAEQSTFEHIVLDRHQVDLDVTLQFSTSLIAESKCFPFKQKEGTVTIAIVNPLDVWALKVVERELGLRRAKFVLVSEQDMQWLLGQYQRYKEFKIQRLFDQE